MCENMLIFQFQIDACTSHVICMRGPLKDFIVKGTLWSNVYGLSLLLLLVTIIAGVVLIYGIFMVWFHFTLTHMYLVVRPATLEPAVEGAASMWLIA